jgi:hypothetical protein
LTTRTAEPGIIPISINLSAAVSEPSSETIRTAVPGGVLSRVTKHTSEIESGVQHSSSTPFRKYGAASAIIHYSDFHRFSWPFAKRSARELRNSALKFGHISQVTMTATAISLSNQLKKDPA